MALTEEKFNQGMSPQEYIDQMKANLTGPDWARPPFWYDKQIFLNIYQALDVPAKAIDQFDGLAGPLRLAVFTADWCGDAISTTPTILRMAESTVNLSVKVFNRDEELDLTNSFLPENRAGTVPVFVVLDSSMKEIARFVETANELVPAFDAMDDTIAQDAGGTPRAASRGRLMAYRRSHAQQWGEVILDAFVRTVAEGLALAPEAKPAVGGTNWPPEP